VSIETTTTKEDTEMPRTRKTSTATAETTEPVVVPLQPGIEEQPPVDQPAELPQDALEPVSETQDAPEAQARGWRGPALNRVELIGRVAKAADVRVTASGMQVAYFRVATNGRDERDTEFHQCTAFGKTAEFISRYIATGRLVHLEGRLQTRAYDDRDGVRRWATTIVVNRLQALDYRRQADQTEQ
jgi:single-strand DNA-binding protein